MSATQELDLADRIPAKPARVPLGYSELLVSGTNERRPWDDGPVLSSW